MDCNESEVRRSIVVLGKPIAQPRHRASARGGFVRMYLPSDHPVHGYKTMIGIEAQRQFGSPIEGAVRLDVLFAFAQPKGRKLQFKISKPDIDNLEKAVMDALTNAGVWLDDAQVVEKHSTKVFGERDATTIFITPLSFPLEDRLK
jgi:Holliday junction resolvase RusA-like endonuclease